MKINVIIIDKKGKAEELPLLTKREVAEKILDKVAVSEEEIFDSKALEKYMDSGINIALDPSSKEVDSHEFANLLKDSVQVNLFIGGAYGFERDFLTKCNNSISFGKITLSHKLVKVVLMEQIFRGLTINNNHPYHK